MSSAFCRSRSSSVVPSGGSRSAGDERRAVGPCEREELLELADASNEQVDVVDVAAWRSCARLRPRPCRPAASRDPGRRGSRSREATRAEARSREPEQAEDDRSAGETLQLDASAERAVDEDDRAADVRGLRSEQRKATTSPISRVVPSRRSGISRGPPRTARRGRAPGCGRCRCFPARCELTVIPLDRPRARATSPSRRRPASRVREREAVDRLAHRAAT